MLFDAFQHPRLPLQNRVVMAPLTRSRALDHHRPNALMVQYYAQRSSAGLIITEGTSPSPNGLGYPRIPGLFNEEQAQAWRAVTHAVHQGGAKIFVQLMHTGRVSASANLPPGGRVVGPTAQACPGETYTDTEGMQPYATPHALSELEITDVVTEFAQAARMAVQVGFDGVELHAANGYLLEQFLNANVNTRTDGYGGSAEGRNRMVLEVARAAVAAIGGERVGIRVSPYGELNATGAFDGVNAQYLALARGLSSLGLVYMHLVDHESMGASKVPTSIKLGLRDAFEGVFIVSGGLDAARAEAALREGRGDLAAFGRAFIANPDLVRRMREGLPLNVPDASTFYTPGPEGYTDYSVAEVLASV